MTPSDLLIHFQSDKVNRPGSKAHHNYNQTYDRILPPYRETATAVLEIGVLRGCSLRAWHDYFQNAEILGIDNDLNSLVREGRIRCFLCDTTERDKFILLSKTLPALDIIIDDGGHVPVEQFFAIAALWPRLKKGGIYIVEDIVKREYLDLFACFQNAELLDLRISGGVADDMMAVLRKS